MPLANAVHQLDAGNRGRGAQEPFEADRAGIMTIEYLVRYGLDVSMVLFDQIVQILRERKCVSSGSTASAIISRTSLCEAGIPI